ncbi:DegQ family serine endoprotease [Nitratidesulfovibrio vulgaris]|uniref:DegQ family serine endoprotease n=1 Tax=Nitratidesulfovibrio vulgaris TaxID=881 RepID=UPI0023015F5A|nr:DegQ family serine endoprotease [Nitratidesulfovibrio vulgaris]WCB45019.1 DegQ family serine endoprotease [Nitratidesulfovibrio vulgaris]
MVRTPRYFALLLLMVAVVLSSTAQAANLPDFRELAKNAGAAVVNISTEKTVQAPENPFGDMLRNAPQGTPFDRFFEQFERFHGKMRPQKQRSLGSGFIISADGYIVTNNHVIADADVIHVNIENETGKSASYDAKVIGTDEETDLALLKIDAKRQLPVLRFGDSDSLEVGEWLMAIGNPFGLDHSVTAGILSAKGRDIRSGPFDNFLQTDASINPGNSGGPLINMKGEVIGINTAIVASGQGIGFAIPSNMAARIIDQLKSDKKVRRGWIGVTIQDVDENTARALGLGEPRGALVGSVMPGEPADKAGIKAGDILLKVEGEDIADSGRLLRRVAALKPGETAKITLWRNGQTKTVNLTLGERTAEHLAAQGGTPRQTPESKQQASSSLGLTVRPPNAEEARALKLDRPQGLLVIAVEEGRPAADADIRAGDVVLSANLHPVNSTADLAKVVQEDAKRRGAVMLQIQRRGQTFFRTIPIEAEK